MRAAARVPVNLLPWREALYQRQRRRLLLTLVLVFAAAVAVAALRLGSQWQQSLSAEHALHEQDIIGVGLNAGLLELQTEYTLAMQHQENLWHLLSSYDLHQRWLPWLAYLERFPESLQITGMTLEDGDVRLSGITQDVMQVRHLLGSQSNLQLRALQFREDGWYVFELGHHDIGVAP